GDARPIWESAFACYEQWYRSYYFRISPIRPDYSITKQNEMSSININYKLGIILFISTLGAHSSWAQQDTAARNIQQQGQVTSAYSVKGTVYDSQTNKPIAGARIT